MTEFDVNADDLQKLSKALKGFDDTLRKELHKGIRDAAKPLIPVVRQALLELYPRRGGLAALMGRSKIRTTFHTGTKDPGVSLIIPGVQAKLGEGWGVIRHPVYARAGVARSDMPWVSQDIEGGAIEKTVAANMDKVLPGIERIVAATAERVLHNFNHNGS